MQGEKSKLNLCETKANLQLNHSHNFDPAMVRKRSFYDFYDLEEDVGLAPDIPATFVSVIAIAAFTVLSPAHDK